MRKHFIILAACIPILCAFATESDLERALSLYKDKLYIGALDILQSSELYGTDPITDGYAVLCALKGGVDGATRLAESYCKTYPSSYLCDDIRLERGYNFFDEESWADALDMLKSIGEKSLAVKYRDEFVFKKAYCNYALGRYAAAAEGFRTVSAMTEGDYSAPSRFLCAYMLYGDKGFSDAFTLFEKASVDERFKDMSEFYMVNCKYGLKDYRYVLSKGVQLYESDVVPEERKPQLARIISESYLVSGDKESARLYYGNLGNAMTDTRADLFYAGSLLFATSDWKGAVDKYEKMTDKTDSLGQIAWYQTALSYIELKNNVAALEAFRQASSLNFDAKMTEDAYFNYAKLAFDLNGDTSVFADYVARYSDKVRGELIYSYIALAALSNRDFQAAIDAYDKLDALDGSAKSNYVHANYLRGVELLRSGSYRKAALCFQAAAYYSDASTSLNQLSRYALAQSMYLDGRYDEAVATYTKLYNESALFGKQQGRAIPYDMAYSYMKLGDLDNAVKWFSKYAADGGWVLRKDALTRKGDCLFAQKKYAEAAAEYQTVVSNWYNVNDIYPYYRLALCRGFEKNSSKRKIEILSKVKGAKVESDYYGDAMFELAKTWQADKKKGRAQSLAIFTEITQKLPGTRYAAKSYLEIGTMKRGSGDIDGAMESYRKVIEGMPESEYVDDALLAMEQMFVQKKQPARYIAYLESIGRGDSKTAQQKEDMVFAAARQLFLTKDYNSALTALKQFVESYPSGGNVPSAKLYIADIYRINGDKEKACDAYSALLDSSDGEVARKAASQYADLSYSMENFSQAQRTYQSILDDCKDAATLLSATTGLMRSSYRARDYAVASKASLDLLSLSGATEELRREAMMTRAQSLLCGSDREGAYALLETLSREPEHKEGAEACLMIVQDLYEKAEYDKVKEKVYSFSASGTRHTSYLARAFIILGDSFVEEGNVKQAKATFESVLYGFKDDPSLTAEVKDRLSRLAEVK